MVSVANRRSVMVLYSDTMSPIGHSVRMVLAEKDINVEINYITEDQRPEELNDLNPYNTVLTLIDRDLVLYDAQIIMEYLDERFPHPPLMPVDPVSRASNRQVRFRVFNDLYSLLDDIEGEDEIAAANARKNMRDILTAIAPAFAQKPYFMSDEYTLIESKHFVYGLDDLQRFIGIKYSMQIFQFVTNFADNMFIGFRR